MLAHVMRWTRHGAVMEAIPGSHVRNLFGLGSTIHGIAIGIVLSHDMESGQVGKRLAACVLLTVSEVVM